MRHEFRASDLLAIVASLFVLLMAAAIPALGRAKHKAAKISCVSNLKQIGLAFRIYANDNGDHYPMHVDSKDGHLREDALSGRMFKIFQILSNELSVPYTVICPADNRTTPSQRDDWQSFTNMNVSYFVGLDAQDTRPNMLLAGDRNLALNGKLLAGVVALGTNSPVEWTKDTHRENGNIGLADGSVQQVTTELLRQQLANSGDATNRLVFPQ